MKVLVIGTGYVGLIQGVCLAELGHTVTCVDNNVEKIKNLKAGFSPIYEPGLDEMLARNLKSGRLHFDTDIKSHVNTHELIFIAVGTPADEQGRADLRAVLEVTRAIATTIDSQRIVVIKSTVPIGTNTLIKNTVREHYQGSFEVVSNPEFLREGSAITDFMHPDRIVVGIDDGSKAAAVLKDLYAPLKAPTIVTNLVTAEMIKYASNSYLATQISFINTIARITEKMGADVTTVAEGMKLDRRIGQKAFLSSGLGYGGSCFPKDVKALISIAHDAGEEFTILEAVEDINQSQRSRFIAMIKRIVGSLEGKKVALWGVAFKPGTDDIREAPAISLIEQLEALGAQVTAYDPIAQEAAQARLPNTRFAKRALEATSDADLLVIATEWSEFKDINLATLKKKMNVPLIFDGRNMLDPKQVKDLGFKYFSIGR